MDNTDPYSGIERHAVSQDFFSVVITTHNRAGLLKRALGSLVSQTESSWEAVIVDDGSSDDTFSQILPYLRSAHKLRYLWKPQSGNVPSRNAGIRLCEGRFVTFLDSDDEYHPDHLETRKNFLLAHPSVRFLYGGVKVLGNPYVPDKNDPSRKIHLKDCSIGGTFVIEKEVLMGLNGFRKIGLGSDADLFERAGHAGVRMAEIATPTYIYHRENQDSITHKLYRK